MAEVAEINSIGKKIHKNSSNQECCHGEEGSCTLSVALTVNICERGGNIYEQKFTEQWFRM